METPTCFILNGIRSPITTASRNSNLAEGIAAETPHGPGPPVIRSRLTGILPDLWEPTRAFATILRGVRFAMPRENSTGVTTRFATPRTGVWYGTTHAWFSDWSNVHPEGSGPGTHANANRRRTCDCRPNFRICCARWSRKQAVIPWERRTAQN